MWYLKGKARSQCDATRDALEHSGDAECAASSAAPSDVGARLSEAQRAHLNSCGECRIFADELRETRRLLSSELFGPQPGPFFMKRVMARIADREAQMEERETQTWAAVPRLAYRLSVIASLALLIAGSWLYQRPAQRGTITLAAADQHSEGLVDGGTPAPDDVLVNLADR
jgi:hypothetical protein